MASFLADLSAAVSELSGPERDAYDSLEFFAEYVIGYGNAEYVPLSKFLREVYYNLQYTADDLLIIGPRGSAKSSAVTVTNSTWSVGHNPLIRIIIALASKELQGTPFIRQLQHIITENERYIRIFGKLKPDRPESWTDSEFIVDRPTPPSGLKDATISVVGVGSSVPSKRADIVVGDDLVNKDNAWSPIKRKRVVDFVLLSLFPILVPGGRRIIVGSRWDPQDLYNELARLWRLDFPKLAPVSLAEAFGPYLGLFDIDEELISPNGTIREDVLHESFEATVVDAARSFEHSSIALSE